MYCENCGKKNEDDARFCEECGAPLVSYEQETKGTVPLYGEPLRREVAKEYEEQERYGTYAPYHEESIYREPVQRPHRKKNNTGVYAAAAVTILLVVALIIMIVMFMKTDDEISKDDDTAVSDLAEETTPAPTEEEAPSVTVTPTAAPEPTITSAPTTIPTPEPTTTPVPTAAPVPATAPAPSVEYVAVKYGLSAPVTDFQFPYSSERLLTQVELDSMESDSIDVMHSKSQLAINEILARYGYTFNPNKSDTAREIYDRMAGKDWYIQAQAQCGYSSANALIADMNSIEKQNIDLINQWQQAHGCYY